MQQINAKISVVAAHIRHPIPGADELAAGGKAVGKGRQHTVPPILRKNAIPERGMA